jgi:hypothetical protein
VPTTNIFNDECCVARGRIKKTYRNYERTANFSYLGPVECDQAHPEAADGTEEAVYDNVIRRNPANPIEHAEPGPQIPWEPIIQEAAKHYEIKEALS